MSLLGYPLDILQESQLRVKSVVILIHNLICEFVYEQVYLLSLKFSLKDLGITDKR